MTTPEIKDLIQPLEQYMTTDQKAELEKILSIGKKWKEEGEQKKQAFRKNNNRDKLNQQILNYKEKKQIREEENKKTLEEIGYYKMSPIEKKKFEQDFIEGLILYSDCKEFNYKKIERILLDDFKIRGIKIGGRFNLQTSKIGFEKFEFISNVLELTGGLKFGSSLDLSNTNIGADGVIVIAEAIEKTGGLKEGTELDLSDTEIGDAGAMAISTMLEKTDGLKLGSLLDLGRCKIGDAGAKAIAEAITKTGGMKSGSRLNLQSDLIGYDGYLVLQKLKDDTRAKGINCTIEF